MTEPTQSEGGVGWVQPVPAEVKTPLVIAQRGNEVGPPSPEGKTQAGNSGIAASDRHGRFSDETHVYLREYISRADQKATFFFAALTALLAFLNTQNVPARWLKDIRQWSIVDTLGFVSMFGLAVGAFFLLAVVFPQLKGSRRGLLFFNAIAEYESSSEYANDVLARSGDDIVRTKLLHCYELSIVCKTKYRVLRVGFWVGAIGVITALLFLLLSKSGPN